MIHLMPQKTPTPKAPCYNLYPPGQKGWFVGLLIIQESASPSRPWEGATEWLEAGSGGQGACPPDSIEPRRLMAVRGRVLCATFLKDRLAQFSQTTCEGGPPVNPLSR